MSTLAPYLHPSRELLPSSSASTNDEVARILRREAERLSLPITWQKKMEAVDTVIDTFRRNRESDWDGYGALPISEAACAEAILFLKKLPSTIPPPDVIPNPDGDVSLEWYIDQRQLFVATFSGTGIISFAGVFGKGSKVHGTEIFTESIPSSLIENLCRLFSQG
jgi:hypothetical protein